MAWFTLVLITYSREFEKCDCSKGQDKNTVTNTLLYLSLSVVTTWVLVKPVTLQHCDALNETEQLEHVYSISGMNSPSLHKACLFQFLEILFKYANDFTQFACWPQAKHIIYNTPIHNLTECRRCALLHWQWAEDELYGHWERGFLWLLNCRVIKILILFHSRSNNLKVLMLGFINFCFGRNVKILTALLIFQ